MGLYDGAGPNPDFKQGDLVTYKETGLAGYLGRFVRYEQSQPPILGGDCVVDWNRIEGADVGTIGSSEWSGNLRLVGQHPE